MEATEAHRKLLQDIVREEPLCQVFNTYPVWIDSRRGCNTLRFVSGKMEFPDSVEQIPGKFYVRIPFR